MIIPTKIIFFGDRGRCQEALGVARKRLNLLLDRVGRGDGMIQQGWQRPLTLDSGQTIRLGVSFNTSVIEIHAPGPPPPLPLPIIPPKGNRCFCNCNLSFGMVVRADKPKMDGWIPVYDVEACFMGKYYVKYENILASDFSKYVVGQAVLVMAYNAFPYSCCAAPLDDVPGTGCNPTVQELATDHDDFRATYRIVPFCPNTIQQYIEVTDNA